MSKAGLSKYGPGDPNNPVFRAHLVVFMLTGGRVKGVAHIARTRDGDDVEEGLELRSEAVLRNHESVLEAIANGKAMRRWLQLRQVGVRVPPIRDLGPAQTRNFVKMMEKMGLITWKDPWFEVNLGPSYPWLYRSGVMASQKAIREGRWTQEGDPKQP